MLTNLTSHDFIIKTVLIYFNDCHNMNEFINKKYNFSIETMTDNAGKTQKLLEQLLQKSDAHDEKLTIIVDNLNMQIIHIKANFKSHKLESKHEIDKIKHTLDDVTKTKT